MSKWRGFLSGLIVMVLFVSIVTMVHAFEYKVRWGDTLWDLSRTYNAGIEKIVAANEQIVDPNLIIAGDVIEIPTETESDEVAKKPTGGQPVPAWTTYVVQPGDTLWGISQQFGTTVNELATINYIYNPNYILVGQALQIPNSVAMPVVRLIFADGTVEDIFIAEQRLITGDTGDINHMIYLAGIVDGHTVGEPVPPETEAWYLLTSPVVPYLQPNAVEPETIPYEEWVFLAPNTMEKMEIVGWEEKANNSASNHVKTINETIDYDALKPERMDAIIEARNSWYDQSSGAVLWPDTLLAREGDLWIAYRYATALYTGAHVPHLYSCEIVGNVWPETCQVTNQYTGQEWIVSMVEPDQETGYAADWQNTYIVPVGNDENGQLNMWCDIDLQNCILMLGGGGGGLSTAYCQRWLRCQNNPNQLGCSVCQNLSGQ